MVLTNSLSDVPSKLGSCFYVFQTMFLNVNFLHATENLIQCLFQQATILVYLEIEIDGYNILRFDRNRHGGGVACYMRNDLSFTKINYLPHDIETIFIDIFLPKTKPMTLGIVYRPLSQTSFLETMNEHFYKLDIVIKETYILGDFNINLYLNNKYVFEKCLTIVRILSHTMYGNTRNFVMFLT